MNNSFAAVSPDGQWLVSGEWGTMDRLLVYPMPGVRFTTPSQNLPYGFAIRPDHPINNIQGCDFTSPTQLLCSSDDSLYGMTKPLLQLDLSGPLGGSDVTAHVSVLGQLPLQSSCTGNFEIEGMDYDVRDGTLRVVVMSPGFCVLTDSKTWRFKHS